MQRSAAELFEAAWWDDRTHGNVTTLRRLFEIAGDSNHPLYRAAVLYLGHSGSAYQAVTSDASKAIAIATKQGPAATELKQRLTRLLFVMGEIQRSGSVTSQDWSKAFREAL